MKNNLKFYLMSALCSIAFINASGHSMNNYNNQHNILNNEIQPTRGLYNDNLGCYRNSLI